MEVGPPLPYEFGGLNKLSNWGMSPNPQYHYNPFGYGTSLARPRRSSALMYRSRGRRTPVKYRGRRRRAPRYKRSTYKRKTYRKKRLNKYRNKKRGKAAGLRNLDIRAALVDPNYHHISLTVYARNTQTPANYSCCQQGFEVAFNSAATAAPTPTAILVPLKRFGTDSVAWGKYNNQYDKSQNVLLNYYTRALPVMCMATVTITMTPNYENLPTTESDTTSQIAFGMRYSPESYLATSGTGSDVVLGNGLVNAVGRKDMVWKRKKVTLTPGSGNSTRQVKCTFKAKFRPWKIMGKTWAQYSDNDDNYSTITQTANPYTPTMTNLAAGSDFPRLQFFIDSQNFMADDDTGPNPSIAFVEGIPINNFMWNISYNVVRTMKFKLFEPKLDPEGIKDLAQA